MKGTKRQVAGEVVHQSQVTGPAFLESMPMRQNYSSTSLMLSVDHSTMETNSLIVMHSRRPLLSDALALSPCCHEEAEHPMLLYAAHIGYNKIFIFTVETYGDRCRWTVILVHTLGEDDKMCVILWHWQDFPVLGSL